MSLKDHISQVDDVRYRYVALLDSVSCVNSFNRIRMGAVPNMKAEGMFYVNDALKGWWDSLPVPVSLKRLD